MSNAIFNLVATSRNLVGKGASRRLRRDNRVLAIVYGGEKQPQSISLLSHDVFKAISYEAFFSHILTLTIDGAPESVIIKDMQRHPVRNMIYHMDFLRVNAKETITMSVPLHYTGEEKAPGIKLGGGFLSRELTELEIKCLPADLPEFINVDISQMELGDSLHLSDIRLPQNVAFAAPIEDNLPIVTVYAPRTKDEPETAAAPVASAVPSQRGSDATQ